MLKRTLSYTFLFTLMFIGALGVSYVVWLEVHKSGMELLSSMQDIRDKSVLSHEYAKLSEKLTATGNKREQLNSYILSSEADTVTLLSELDQTAQKFGIDLATKKLELIKTKEEGFDELSVSFIFSGGETAAMSMLHLLETLPLESHITTLSLTRKGVPGGEGLTEIDLNMVISINE